MKKVRVLAGIVAITPAALVLAPHVAQAATREANCNAAPDHWTVFAGNRGLTCFGYNGGTWHGLLKSQDSICGGNNYGFYSGIGPIRDMEDVGFHQGSTFAALPYTRAADSPDSISAVHISNWAGSDVCADGG
jgi:hypothetical protein